MRLPIAAPWWALVRQDCLKEVLSHLILSYLMVRQDCLKEVSLLLSDGRADDAADLYVRERAEWMVPRCGGERNCSTRSVARRTSIGWWRLSTSGSSLPLEMSTTTSCYSRTRTWTCFLCLPTSTNASAMPGHVDCSSSCSAPRQPWTKRRARPLHSAW